MATPVDRVAGGEPRVAVYFDFDNIVISRYAQVHGQNSFWRDYQQRDEAGSVFRERAESARVDVDAIIDYATSYGSLTLCRAYADWSHSLNSSYRNDLIARAVDLVQLFPLSVRRKNGADIRLAVDAMEDLFLLPDVTHVVIVAGDSDFVPLAQKARRLGRYVVGIGVSGGTSRALTAACDEYADYDALLPDEEDDTEPAIEPQPVTLEPGAADEGAETGKDEPGEAPALARRRPGPLLRRALMLLESKTNEEWQSASSVKNQMLRMDPTFQEREHGFSTFTEFVKAYPGLVAIDETGSNRLRRRPGSQ